MKRTTIILCAFLITKIVLQFVVVNPIYELHRDEFLHLDQAKHLAWGFHSVPPLTSWISWLILQLGNTYFWIKFFPALFGALTILVVWKTIESLKGGLFACILTATALTFSVLLRINILYQPNSVDILCWALLYFTLIKYIQTQNTKWLYWMAISFALGFLNKYNIVFGLLGLIPALLVTEQRNIFLKPQLYFAIILGFLLISPNLIWQFQNDFPVFKHLKELNDRQLVHVQRLDFIKEQLFFFIGSAFVLIAAFISFFRIPAFKPYRFLFFSYIFTIALFLLLKAKGYYAIGLYPVLFAFGAIYLSVLLQQGWKFYLRYLAIAVVLFFAYPLIETALPIYTPSKYFEFAEKGLPFSKHRWEDGKNHPISQDFADMIGWKELAAKTDSIYASLPDKDHVFILCDNYGQAGAINYYTKIKGLQAYTFSDDYLNWLNLNQEIKTAIRIKDVGNTEHSRDHRLFNRVSVEARIENQFAREKGTQIIVLAEPTTDISALLRREKASGNLQ